MISASEWLIGGGARIRHSPSARSRAPVRGAEHQLADVQRIACTRLPHPARDPLLGRPLQHRLHQLLGVGSPSRFSSSRGASRSFHSETIASWHGSSLRTVATTKAAGTGRQMQDQRRRSGVEELPVIDADYQPALAGELAHRRRGPPQQLERIVERTSAGITPANAPSGTVAALRVAWAQVV